MRLHNFIWLCLLAVAICFDCGQVMAESLNTKDYWILKDGFDEPFQPASQLKISYGPYGNYVMENVYDVDWPGNEAPIHQFFNYDTTGKLIYYGAESRDQQYNNTWVYIPESPREFLPAVVETGKLYTHSWTRKEYKNGAYQGNGRDTYRISVNGPQKTKIPSGETFDTYEFKLIVDWEASTGSRGKGETYIYYLAKDIGWLKLIRDGVTYELLNGPAPSQIEPTSKTGWPTSVTTGSATLNGEVNANGTDTTAYFQYGTTVPYGSTTSVQNIGSASSEVGVSAELAGLTENTTYHFRVVATNSEGTSYGEDRAFRTTVFYVEPSGGCGGHFPCYPTIQGAVDDAASGGTIRIATESYDEKLIVGQSGNIIFEGGWNTFFTSRSATGSVPNTGITGTVNVSGDWPGAVVVDGLRLETNSAQTLVVTPSSLSLSVGESGSCTISGGTTPYSASSSNTSVATASISGSTLTVTGITADSATVTVSDSAAHSATVSVTVSGSSLPTYTNSLGQGFVLIPAGTFTMGSPLAESGRFTEEGPQHQVTLTESFYMQTTEVTQAEWEAVMGNNPSLFPGCPTCPVERVSWDEAMDFVGKMNTRGEGTYNLPTEAQWEYAARAGSTTAFYNGDITEIGTAYDPNLYVIGWYQGNSDSQPHPVGQKTPNSWGLYDMSGNVWEWCLDWFSENYYMVSPSTDPTGPSAGSERVRRSGSWYSKARYCRSANRRCYSDGSDGNIGFRLVRQP